MNSLLNAVGAEALIEEVDVNLLRGGEHAGEAQQQSVRGHHGAAGLRTGSTQHGVLIFYLHWEDNFICTLNNDENMLIYLQTRPASVLSINCHERKCREAPFSPN